MKYKYDSDTGLVYGKRGKPIGSVNIDSGYLLARIKGRLRTLHRFIFELMDVDIPEGYQVDHINHVKTDNRWENLRLVTPRENHKNRSMHSNNKSGVMGVYWYKQSNRWTARIKVDENNMHLGYFTEFHKAVDARKNAEVLYGFHSNHGKM